VCGVVFDTLGLQQKQLSYNIDFFQITVRIFSTCICKAIINNNYIGGSMQERGPISIEAGFGSTEAKPGRSLTGRIEGGAEKGEAKIEYAPDDTDTIFVWDGHEYVVTHRAAVLGAIIYIDSSEQRNGSSWIGLKVTGISKTQPSKIESLEKHSVKLKPAAIKLFISQGLVFQAFKMV